jgi:GNAT superfamily N-acetyltransferase
MSERIIEFLDWDSQFFGLKIGRIESLAYIPTKEDFLEEVRREKYDLIYIFSYADLKDNGFWESVGCRLTDTIVTLSMPFEAEKYRNAYGKCFNELTQSDLDACQKIAETVAPKSRFYREKLIGPELTRKMYRQWINASLDGSFSDGLFMEKIDGKVVGIHTIKTEKTQGIFTLTGVDPGFLKQGIGRKLWNQSFAFWAAQQSNIIKVTSRFSIRNFASFNFHLAMNFNKIEQVKYIFHYSTL